MTKITCRSTKPNGLHTERATINKNEKSWQPDPHPIGTPHLCHDIMNACWSSPSIAKNPSSEKGNIALSGNGSKRYINLHILWSSSSVVERSATQQITEIYISSHTGDVLYPFGEAVGDVSLPDNDDGDSGSIFLDLEFRTSIRTTRRWS